MYEPTANEAESPSGAAGLSQTVYSHLKAIAQRKLSDERPGHTLQATALVHEAYMRMEQAGHLPEQGAPELRSRFYWAAAEAMRRILIDHARAKNASKRGGKG